jgi:hypothetical protein
MTGLSIREKYTNLRLRSIQFRLEIVTIYYLLMVYVANLAIRFPRAHLKGGGCATWRNESPQFQAL